MGAKLQGGKRWVPGIIKEKSGNMMYQVLIEGQNLTWCYHANQLKTRLTVSHLVESHISQVSSQPSDYQPASSSRVGDSQPEQSIVEQPPLTRSARVLKPKRPWPPSNN